MQTKIIITYNEQKNIIVHRIFCYSFRNRFQHISSSCLRDNITTSQCLALCSQCHISFISVNCGICGIDFFYFSSVYVQFFFLNLDSVRNEFSSVRVQKCGSIQIVVIYYSCNRRVVNLQQILQQWMT